MKNVITHAEVIGSYQPGGFREFIKKEAECSADISRCLVLGDHTVLQTCQQVFKRHTCFIFSTVQTLDSTLAV